MNDDLPGIAPVAVEQWESLVPVDGHDQVAVEVPVALVYNGVSHAVMLASPGDLEDLALGFTLSEAIVYEPAEVLGIEATQTADGITNDIELTARAFARLGDRRRTLAGTTGCGLCGVESLQQVVRDVAPVPDELTLSAAVVAAAPEQLASAQPVRAATGAVHVAAWINTSGELQLAREDVGRHNALDKLIGALGRATSDHSVPDRSTPGSLTSVPGFALISSRASYEMVQKAATVGIEVLVAVSAPTSLAVEQARTLGLTLAGFARGGQFKVYTHPHRILRA